MTQDAYVQLLIYLAAPLILLLIGGVIALWKDVQNHKLHVSENYTKKTDIDKVKEDTDEMKKLMYAIAGKVGVAFSKE